MTDDITAPQPDGSASAVQEALHSVATNSADDQALDTLAAGQVLLPVPAGGETNPQVTLPVVEQSDGTQLVPVFTSRSRLSSAFPHIEQYRTVPLGDLARRWPSEELSLIIDAGGPDEVALSAQGVRAMLVRGAA
ncbi:SseB family protein [Streptomyces sp. NPDC051940]|uniref:SseB family protein n=1 Tax=Streptomyces sp. NPDC051940 TaxID=3155675 RepID=UPI00343D7F26